MLNLHLKWSRKSPFVGQAEAILSEGNGRVQYYHIRPIDKFLTSEESPLDVRFGS